MPAKPLASDEEPPEEMLEARAGECWPEEEPVPDFRYVDDDDYDAEPPEEFTESRAANCPEADEPIVPPAGNFHGPEISDVTSSPLTPDEALVVETDLGGESESHNATLGSPETNGKPVKKPREKSSRKKPPRTPPDSERDPVCFTDVGNGKRFAADHGKIVRHVHPWKNWLIWDGTRWRPDDSGQTNALAKKTVLGLYKTTKAEIDKLSKDGGEEAQARLGTVEKLLDWAVKSQDSRRITSMINLARSEPGIPVQPELLDKNPLYLNCKNGTLDLKSGRLLSHEQEDYQTKICPVEFDPAAKCPTWERFLLEIFAGSESLVGYMNRLAGYWMTGLTTEHALPVFWGVGANGKSTMINAIFDVLGPDFAGKTPRDLLVAMRGDKHPTVLAWLYGKRFVAGIETAEGARLDEALIKELTGGDPVTGRRMQENYWTFLPTHKIALVTNHKPTVRGTDHAIWRRLRLVPFTVVFPEEKQDKRLAEKLQLERAGILNWLLSGCLEWQTNGLADPPEVLTATGEYRTSQDILGTFLAENCLTGPDYRCKAGQIFAAYTAWAKGAGETPKSQAVFGEAMTERGFQRKASNGTWYLGIAVRQAETQDEAQGGWQ